MTVTCMNDVKWILKIFYYYIKREPFVSAVGEWSNCFIDLKSLIFITRTNLVLRRTLTDSRTNSTSLTHGSVDNKRNEKIIYCEFLFQKKQKINKKHYQKKSTLFVCHE